jgi:hypothetical protein
MTHQNDEKLISKTIGCLVGGINTAFIFINDLIAITYHLTRIGILISKIGHRQTLKILTHPGLHHTRL